MFFEIFPNVGVASKKTVLMLMASLTELYGQKHQKETRQMKASSEINSWVNNICQMNLRFRVNTSEIWKQGNIYSSAKREFVKRMQLRNPKLKCQWINKVNKQELAAIPQLIVNSPVEYLLVLDNSKDKTRLYTIYLTPREVAPY